MTLLSFSDEFRENILTVYNPHVTPKEKSIVFDGIPGGSRMLLMSAPKSKNCIAPSSSYVNIYTGNVFPLLNGKVTYQCVTNIHQYSNISRNFLL